MDSPLTLERDSQARLPGSSEPGTETAAAEPAPIPTTRRTTLDWKTTLAPCLNDYAAIIGQGELDELRSLAHGLEGKSIKMVNSTGVGGGVAEMLNRLVPLLDELGVRTHWDVITGGNDFFEVTKAFHNRCRVPSTS